MSYICTRVANKLKDAFTNINKVTKSHIPPSNTSAQIEVIIKDYHTKKNGTKKKSGLKTRIHENKYSRIL